MREQGHIPDNTIKFRDVCGIEKLRKLLSDRSDAADMFVFIADKTRGLSA